MALGPINGLEISQKDIDEIIATIPERHKYLRVENETKTILGADEYTDVFVYNNATIIFGDAAGLDSLKTLYIAQGCHIETSTAVTAINIVGDEFSQISLPYTATENMHLVGYTSDNLPMFAQDATYVKQTDLAATTGTSTTTAMTQAATSAAIVSVENTSKTYTDNVAATKLSLTGGVMTGNIDMSNNVISNLATPLTDNNATNKKYVDEQIAANKYELPTAKAFTLSSENWVEDNINNRYTYDLNISDLHVLDYVNIDLSNEELIKAQNNKLLPGVNVQDGKIQFYAKQQPTEDIVGQYWIEIGQ